MGPCDLTSVLEKLTPAVDPSLLVGSETLDDAAALKVSDDLAILFTADFITPVVDDAAAWGRIAGANSLSDIYAMGGRPLAALNLVCWPGELPGDLLSEVLQGGAAAAADAGCLIVGGHTVQDREPKYGMAVIGTVHPDRIIKNRGARPGDLLYLTKPLGTGILATAIKAGLAEPDQVNAAVASMGCVNRQAAEAAVAAEAVALTDVTGFGLAGHLAEMLDSSGDVGVDISLDAVPVLPGARQQMALGMIPAGAYRNRDAYASRVCLGESVDKDDSMLLFDPQTSGGLLVAISPDFDLAWRQALSQQGADASRIGTFRGGLQGLVHVR